jgi:hypothetical protein
MIVKIGSEYYDSTLEPILLILADSEKEHIASMGEQKKYCSFPDDWNMEDIKEFMKVPQEVIDKVNYEE